MTALRDRARVFWKRFEEVARALAADPEDAAALEELDDAVGDLGPYAWEIGPGAERDWMFALSPSGDEDLYRETREIVSAAPDLPGWEILPARPAKEWDGRFSYGEPEPAECDTRRWACSLRAGGDGRVDVLLFAPDLRAMDADDRQIAGELAVVSWIGEVLFIERVDRVEVRVDAMPAGAGLSLSRLAGALRGPEAAGDQGGGIQPRSAKET